MPGVPSDFDLTSFDGTIIRIHWFPDPSADGRARPTVLMGPGWGESGDTDTSQAGIQGALSIAQLWQGGFNVLTWDPRGFGHSTGAAEVDSPNDEGRDVSAMINWVAQQPGVELDRPGVPRVGMVGESYGGRDSVRGGRAGLPDRCHRSHHRLALTGDQSGQEPDPEGGVGEHPRERVIDSQARSGDHGEPTMR